MTYKNFANSQNLARLPSPFSTISGRKRHSKDTKDEEKPTLERPNRHGCKEQRQIIGPATSTREENGTNSRRGPSEQKNTMERHGKVKLFWPFNHDGYDAGNRRDARGRRKKLCRSHGRQSRIESPHHTASLEEIMSVLRGQTHLASGDQPDPSQAAHTTSPSQRPPSGANCRL